MDLPKWSQQWFVIGRESTHYDFYGLTACFFQGVS